ncbi:MAG: hypothetical protein J6K26_03105 [Lachnospiraceae bacterium]|nr:hypothetical protein [Lachnospiraceae bacterium]
MDHNQILVLQRRKRRTRFIPPIMMLSAGAVASIMCLIAGYELLKSMIILFVTLLVFAILGTIVKAVVDSFRTVMDYSQFFDEDGEVVEK